MMLEQELEEDGFSALVREQGGILKKGKLVISAADLERCKRINGFVARSETNKLILKNKPYIVDGVKFKENKNIADGFTRFEIAGDTVEVFQSEDLKDKKER